MELVDVNAIELRFTQLLAGLPVPVVVVRTLAVEAACIALSAATSALNERTVVISDLIEGAALRG